MSDTASLQGTVVATYRRHTLIRDSHNRLVRCQQRKSAGQVVCGDIVTWQQEDEEHGIITAIEQRKTVLQRPDINGKLRVIAANIDQVFIIVAHQPKLNPGLIDRYLVAAENSQIKPVIVLNKIDLLEQAERQQLESELRIYQDIGYPLVFASAKQQHGREQLLAQLKGNNNIFVGQSGVGKSSLINNLLDNANARVGEMSSATGKGKHTTTTAYLYPLEQENSYIIDSPGVREFGLIDLAVDDIFYGFREFRDFLGACRFRNCSHSNEPGCALLQALDDNKISQRRWHSCQQIIASLN